MIPSFPQNEYQWRAARNYAIYIAALLFLSWCARSCHCQTRYVVPCSQQLWHASLDSLQRFRGIKESTNHNDGAQVAALLRHVGLPQGYAWCAAAQVAAFDTARGTAPLPIARSAMANGIYARAAQSGSYAGTVARDGDLIVWRHAGTQSGHIGRIERVKYPVAHTLEGNTSAGAAGSQRDGGGFYARIRKIGSLGTMQLRGFIGRK